ncbi:hypothetical protein [Actinocatenispora rupis]|uniref:Iron-containing redox enzyme n=1 Tax=Actinocatenispora rupis TaxID=519421 RepID=A0A8J3JEA7_9ACTN|nr:hypothetical protein [Actinocatenispora rupis]GID14892.1 hypothetical protein Aru02nite_57810 [Actinocatenispora rupis]
MSTNVDDLTGTSRVERVAEHNRRQQEAFAGSRLCRLLADDTTDPATKAAVTTYLQPWSDAFQRMITVRVEHETDPSLRALAIDHRDDETGHNKLLAASRAHHGVDAPVVWDPVIEMGAAWIVDALRTLPGVLRAVLAHLAVESAALTFFTRVASTFPDDIYFQHHNDVDAEHVEMGYQVLRERTDWTEDEVVTLLDHAWQVMTIVADRIAERAVADAAGGTSAALAPARHRR